MKKLFHAIYVYLRQTDLWLWTLCLGLSCVGLIMLAGIAHSELISKVGPRKVLVQLIATGLGCIAALILSKFDYHTLTKLWKLHVPASYLLVLLTFFVGHGTAMRQNDKSWLYVPGTSFTIQPTEFLKISFILILAYHLSIVHDQLNRPQNLLAVCAHGAVPILLIHFQGDDGTAIVFAGIFICMVFAAGLSWKYIIWAFGSLVVLTPAAWFFILNEDQKQRIRILFRPEMQDKLGDYYQQYQAKLAIGSGKIWGKGIFADTHTPVPEAHNDFIFAFIGESLGFVGCLAVIVLLILLSTRLLSCAQHSQDMEGRLICIGIFAMISVQAIINIGMCLSLLPVIGITLPLVSNGGTSVLSTYMSIGLALSVHIHTTKNLFSE